MIQLALHRTQTRFDVSQALAVSQLREGHRKVLIPTRETSEMTITAVAGHTFLEFLVREMGDQFREHEPASMHPPLSAEGGNSLAAPIFAVLDFKSFPPKKPPPSTIERTCGISQSTLPDTSDYGYRVPSSLPSPRIA